MTVCVCSESRHRDVQCRGNVSVLNDYIIEDIDEQQQVESKDTVH